MADIDNDGIADGEVFDLDENGTLDTFVEKDLKRNLVIWHTDKNGNGVTELMIVFTYNNNGGKMAIIYKDPDEDGGLTLVFKDDIRLKIKVVDGKLVSESIPE